MSDQICNCCDGTGERPSLSRVDKVMQCHLCGGRGLITAPKGEPGMTDSELEEYRWKLDRQRVSVLEKENDELKSRSKILEQQLADLRQLVKELPFGRKP